LLIKKIEETLKKCIEDDLFIYVLLIVLFLFYITFSIESIILF